MPLSTEVISPEKRIEVYQEALRQYLSRKEDDPPGLCFYVHKSHSEVLCFNISYTELGYYYPEMIRPERALGVAYWWSPEDTKSRIDFVTKNIDTCRAILGS
jgi:hypothetical protein